MFDNGPHVFVKSTFGLMSHSGLLYSMWHSEFCRIQNFVTFGIMSCSGLFRIWYYVAFGVLSFGVMSHSGLCRIQGYVAFRVMSFGIMSHSALCHIWTYVIRDCVVWRNVVQHTVGVSYGEIQNLPRHKIYPLIWTFSYIFRIFCKIFYFFSFLYINYKHKYRAAWHGTKNV